MRREHETAKTLTTTLKRLCLRLLEKYKPKEINKRWDDESKEQSCLFGRRRGCSRLEREQNLETANLDQAGDAQVQPLFLPPRVECRTGREPRARQLLKNKVICCRASFFSSITLSTGAVWTELRALRPFSFLSSRGAKVIPNEHNGRYNIWILIIYKIFCLFSSLIGWLNWIGSALTHNITSTLRYVFFTSFSGEFGNFAKLPYSLFWELCFTYYLVVSTYLGKIRITNIFGF